MEYDNQLPKNPGDIAGKPLQPIIKSDTTTSESLAATNAALPPLPKEDFSETTKALHRESMLPPLRTYESDIAGMMKEKQTSTVSVAVAEQTKKVQDVPKAAPKVQPSVQPKAQPEVAIQEIPPAHSIRPRNVAEIGPLAAPTSKPLPVSTPTEEKRDTRSFSMTVSGLLIISGLAALTAVYVLYRDTGDKRPPAIPAQEIIATDTSKEIALGSTDSIQSIIQKELAVPAGRPGSLTRLSFVELATSTDEVASKRLLDTETFAIRLDTQMTSALVRSFDEHYITGLHSQSGRSHPFFIIKIASYENAYAGMLNWEKTMATDLGTIITTAPTSTGFADQVIKNKDARVLNDASGKPVLVYSFADRKTLVITTNIDTLTEIFARLVTSQFVR